MLAAMDQVAGTSALFETFRESWLQYQRLLTAAVEPLGPDQLGLRAAPHLRSIGETVAHVIGARARWFSDDIGRGGEELAKLARWDRDPAPWRDGRDLAGGLAATWQAMQESIEGWTPEEWAEVFRDETNDPESFTRRWVVWHVIEHDIHHGGEASTALGMHGLSAPEL
jgi:uncharacterized damage-inducible protein DinB